MSEKKEKKGKTCVYAAAVGFIILWVGVFYFKANGIEIELSNIQVDIWIIVVAAMLVPGAIGTIWYKRNEDFEMPSWNSS